MRTGASGFHFHMRCVCVWCGESFAIMAAAAKSNGGGGGEGGCCAAKAY